MNNQNINSDALEERDKKIRDLQRTNEQLISILSSVGPQRAPFKKIMLAAVLKRIKKHKLFDENYYKNQAKQHGVALPVDSLWHYISLGYLLGFDPHTLFSSDWYFSENQDVAHSNINPLVHYLRHGHKEGRDPHPVFNSDYYRSQFDVEAFRSQSPLEHYLTHSDETGLSPSPLFDTFWYMDAYEDLKKANINPLVHYLNYGHKELRNPNPEFHEGWYKQSYLKNNAISALEHYVRKGFADGCRANASGATTSVSNENGAFRKTVLVVAHSVGEKIFGAEKSLIDVLNAIDQSRFRVVLAIPKSVLSYISAVQNLVDKVAIYKLSLIHI